MGPGTHDVVNQPPPLLGHDVLAADPVLSESLARWAGPGAASRLGGLGLLAGTAEAAGWGFDADRDRPRLRTHDRYGNRVDEVEFHPAYHRLLGTAVEHGLHAAPWAQPGRAGAHVVRAAGFVVSSQVDAGTGCPVSMTYASVPVLRRGEVASSWLPAVTATRYEPRLEPLPGKGSALVGMAMTEKQGGSDVRAGTTRATYAPDGTWRLTGHKWFCSAPMSDGFLVLAQAPQGLTCFLLPRVLPDGARNAVRLQRLKDKLGNRSNASAEIELDAAVAHLVGEPGQGVRTIIDMVALTRLDCVLGSAALMRQAVAQATHHAAHRSAFGARLADQPLMRSVLADLAVESEAATLLGMRLAASVEDMAGDDEEVPALRRLGTAVGKFWVCKRATAVTGEALECLGGNGYVEESVMPRLYREAPVNSVWEGSGNVNALDVLRALARTPQAGQALLDEVDLAAGADHRLDAAAKTMRAQLEALVAGGAEAARSAAAQRGARRLVERLAVVLQGSLLVRFSPDPVADAFVASRVAGDGGATFGTLPDAVGDDALRAIVQRHTPVVP